MKIIFATHNENKANELRSMLVDTNIKIVTLNDLNITDEIVEDGNTFSENALIKALEISKLFDGFVLADDSGLEVEALNNEPGIYSSRYSDKGDEGNNIKVLEKLKNELNRNARFVTWLSLCKNGIEIKNFNGELRGKITLEPKGSNGFGYDPIFIPNGYSKTLGELPATTKNSISHRKNALTKFVAYFIPSINKL